MKKIGLILLFIFIPILNFKLFLNVDFGEEEVDFAILSCLVMIFLYVIAYVFALKKASYVCMKKGRAQFIKTVLTNQGRSAAFVGGAILAIKEWAVFAAIYMSLLGIFLFAFIPYILSVLHGRDKRDHIEHGVLPFYLRIFPWYLIIFPISAVIIHSQTGITTSSYDWGKILNFLAAITIPAALYYVGSGIKIQDLRKEELKKLFLGKGGETLLWVKEILLLTMVITPSIITIIFGTLLFLHLIPSEWFAVLVLNSILPITSTNMFLVPYGIHKKVTALAVTWTTIFALPLLVILINLFSFLFI